MDRKLTPNANSLGHDDASWVMIGLALLLFLILQLVEPFSFGSAGVVQAVASVAILLGVQLFYIRKRQNLKIAAIVASMNQLIIFSIVGAALTYMVAAQGGALWDASFARFDEALGFSWLDYLNWVNDRPQLGLVYHLAYVTLIPQLVVLLMALGISGRLYQLRVVMFASLFAGMASILISGITPAMSNFIYRGLSPEDYPNLSPAAAFLHQAHLEAIRDGTLRYIELSKMEGIVTFPSFHASLGAIFIWGFLRAPLIGWLGAIWASIMILATPIDGAHYLIDVLAGIGIAAIGIIAGKRIVFSPWTAMMGDYLKSWPFHHSHGAFAR